MTLEQVANIVGVGKSTVRKWETGMIANMRRDKIALLASALGTTPAFLMGWENDSGERDLGLTALDIAKWLNTDPETVESVMDDMGWPDINLEILSKISAEIGHRKNVAVKVSLTESMGAKVQATTIAHINAALGQMTPEGQNRVAGYVEDILPRYQATAAPESTPAPQEGKDITPPPNAPQQP